MKKASRWIVLAYLRLLEHRSQGESVSEDKAPDSSEILLSLRSKHRQISGKLQKGQGKIWFHW